MESTTLRGCIGLFLKNFFSNFRSHIKDSKWAENVFSSIVEAVTEAVNKSDFSLQMGNCPIPVAKHSGPCLNKHVVPNNRVGRKMLQKLIIV